jgi:hypothetical protein
MLLIGSVFEESKEMEIKNNLRTFSLLDKTRCPPLPINNVTRSIITHSRPGFPN